MTETKIYARHIVIGDEPPFRTIHLNIWNSPENPTRKLDDILDELNKRMKAELPKEVAEHFEGFSNMAGDDYEYKAENGVCWAKNYRWIAVYPVTGDSEGHYIHVDTIRPNRLIFLSKTFGGWDVACQIANLAGKLLGA